MGIWTYTCIRCQLDIRETRSGRNRNRARGILCRLCCTLSLSTFFHDPLLPTPSSLDGIRTEIPLRSLGRTAREETGTDGGNKPYPSRSRGISASPAGVGVPALRTQLVWLLRRSTSPRLSTLSLDRLERPSADGERAISRGSPRAVVGGEEAEGEESARGSATSSRASDAGDTSAEVDGKLT